MQPPLIAPIEPPEALAACLRQWGSWGAVVEHYLFPVAEAPTVDGYFVAACSGLVKAAQYGQQPKSQWEQKIDWNALSLELYERRTPQQFFGWQFDVRERMLYLWGKKHYQLYFSANDVAEVNGRYEFEIRRDMDLEDSIQYAHALLDPPYALHSSSGCLWPIKKREPDLRTAFSQLCDELFGTLDTLEIFSWPTDCSAYFDAGHEWWGTGFWTVYSPDKKWIVTILASSTD